MIDNDMVRRLADAARIELAPEEVTRLADQLSDILGEIAGLASVPADAHATADVPAHVDAHAHAHSDAEAHADAQPLRTDVVAPDKLHGSLSRFAPEIRDGFFTVPVLPTHRQDTSP